MKKGFEAQRVKHLTEKMMRSYGMKNRRKKKKKDTGAGKLKILETSSVVVLS